MTDKEFKRLSRYQLIEIIYQLQLKQEELTADNEKLSKAVEDKRIQISEAGNIAKAALEIHNVLQAAQDAAEHYLEEMKRHCDEECQKILDKAKEDASAIIAKAQQDAAQIVLKANNGDHGDDPAKEAISGQTF